MEYRHGLREKVTALCLAAVLFTSLSTTPVAADGISLIRDAETENLMRSFATPIWIAAGLEPEAVHIYIVNDDTINAFVAGGQRLFLNTGLIIQCDDPSQLIGVIAHETGHMAGGHLVRAQEGLSGYKLPMILSAVLGVGAMAAGAGDAGMAILAGGAQVVQRGVLAYSREQEARADQAGATFLDRAQLSGKGMLELFSKFRDEEALSTQQQDPFVQSHPISEDRLAALEDRIKASRYYNKPDTLESIHELKMVQAKLKGFMDQPDATFRNFPSTDQSDYAHYARSIAYHQESETDKAMTELDPLIKRYPDNPYLWELKGQINFESGRIADAVDPYRMANRLKPNEPQLELGLGQTLLALEKPATDAEARSYLQSSAKSDPENPFTFYQLSIAYGRLNDIGRAELATAEYYDALGAMRDAKGHAKRAAKMLKAGSPDWLRAQDIVAEAGNAGSDDDDNGG